MRPGGGKAKGAAFEREIAKHLSLWITKGKHADVFWRSAMSGGRATVNKQHTLSASAGDLSAIREEGNAFIEQWYVEIKFYAKLNVDRFLIEGTGPLTIFWHKAIEEAKKYGKLPLLIAKENGREVIVVCSVAPNSLSSAAQRARTWSALGSPFVFNFKRLFYVTPSPRIRPAPNRPPSGRVQVESVRPTKRAMPRLPNHALDTGRSNRNKRLPQQQVSKQGSKRAARHTKKKQDQ